MKKLMIFLILAAGFFMAGCNKDGQSNEINPLALMGTYGPYTLTVNVTYDGTAATDGTGKIYVYLFDALGLTSRDPIYSGSTDAAYAGGVTSINVEHIKAGDYYVLVFYDYVGGDNPDNRYDRYTLYGGAGPVGFAGSAAVYTVTGDATIGGTIDFDDTYQLQGQSKYMLPCTLTVNATYNGTDFTFGSGLATGRLFVYLYDSMGTDTRTPDPVWVGSTSTAATIGDQTAVTLSNITAGSYYAVLFYDFNEEAGHYDSEGDRYLLYNNKQFAGQATQIVIADGGSATWDNAVFDNSYTLQTGSAYMTAPVALTVKATYNGTAATTGLGNMHVYLYSALTRGTRLGGNPSYTGSVAAIVGDEATVTIPGVDQGYYYVLVFYDYASGANADSATDRYVFYDGAQYPANADIVLLDSDRELSGITFDNDYTFQTNVVGDTLYMQPGSLTLTATYTGTAGTGSDLIANYIYVYLYDSLGTGTRSPLPIYTGSTGSAVTVGNPADITINNILPGSYYIVVFYNFAATGATNPDTRYDRYVIYDNVEFPASPATPFNIISGSNTLTGVSFGDGYQLNSGAAFN